jgi:hypothetical protein
MTKPHFVARRPQIFGKVKKGSPRRTVAKMALRSGFSIFGPTPEFKKSNIGKETQKAIFKAIHGKDSELAENSFYSIMDVRGVPNRKRVNKLVKDFSSTSPSVSIRLSTIEYLSKLKTPSAKRALKKMIFDSERDVRSKALQTIAKKEGYLGVLREIHKVFPLNCPPIDKLFFHNRNNPHEIDFSKTLFKGHYRGAPIYITTEESHKILEEKNKPIANMGEYKDGKILINGNEQIVPKKFRSIVIAHEFGEYWGHEFGLVTMLIEAKRKNQLEDFWNFFKNKPFDFIKERQLQKLIEKYPKDFRGLEKVIK